VITYHGGNFANNLIKKVIIMKTQFLNQTALVIPTINPVVGGDIAPATKEARVSSASARKIYLNEVEGFGQVVSVQRTIGGEAYAHYTLANYLCTVTAARFTTQTIGLEGSLIAGTVDSNIAALRVAMNGGDLPATNKVKPVVMASKELSSTELFEQEVKFVSAELLASIEAQIINQQTMLLEHGLKSGTSPDFYGLSVQGSKHLDLVKSLAKLDRERFESTILAVTDRLECDFFKLDSGKLLFIFDDSMTVDAINAQIAEKFDSLEGYSVVSGDTLPLYKELDKAEKAASKVKDRKLARELSEQLEQLETCLVLVIG
jgi:hypothetical protein